MRALVLTKHGAPGVLKIRELPAPEPKAGEVRVRVRFAGLNFADVQARVGLYPDAPKPPCVVGYEVAGELDALGAEVSGLRVGDRVAAMTHFGGQAEQVCVPASQVFPLPAALTLEQGAALPVNFLTAHHLLHQVGRVKQGDRVLIHQAAGGVGTAALQLGKLAGLVMFGTASAQKHDRLRQLGLQHPIDYRVPKGAAATSEAAHVRAEIEALAGPRGLRLVIDPIGPDSWKQGYAMLEPGGQLLVFGFSAMVSGATRNPFRVVSQVLQVPRYSPLKVMGDNRSVGGVNMGAPEFWANPALVGPQLQTLVRLAGEGAIAPLIDRVFPLDQGAEAHAYVQSRQSFGKVLLSV